MLFYNLTEIRIPVLPNQDTREKINGLSSQILLAKGNRKVFNFRESKQIFAAGVIFYKTENNKVYFLLEYVLDKNMYEDIGGKVDLCDDTIYDTVIREVHEETNEKILLTRERIETSPYCYNEKSKYMIFFVKANINEETLNCGVFGEIENHDNIKRIIDWISGDELKLQNKNINPRLQFNIDFDLTF
jgi:hypothetical protein